MFRLRLRKDPLEEFIKELRELRELLGRKQMNHEKIRVLLEKTCAEISLECCCLNGEEIGPYLELCITEKVFSMLCRCVREGNNGVYRVIFTFFHQLINHDFSELLMLQMEFHESLGKMLVFALEGIKNLREYREI